VQQDFDGEFKEFEKRENGDSTIGKLGSPIGLN
jgi:hypothetical protein